MIFNDIENYLESVESYLMDIHGVAVDFDPMGMDEYWINDRVITINDVKSQEKQLFVLLHEAGHVILRDNPEFKDMFPDSETSKVEILKEEIMAWEEARKLAKKLQIPLSKEWQVHVRRAIMKYVHWVRL
tara:strand:- start:1799 stop:2188 length:390 start_codon:yes stop_codon:yes gene_type:complete